MDKHIIIGLAAVLLLGLFAQWVAWRYRFPSILLLLIVGFVAGPISGFLDPNLLFGDLLFPIVSICVAIILFEGGLNLQFKELGNVGTIVLRLVTVGVLVTAIFGTVAARAFLGLDLELALLLGAILTVSGPTVILPLLRHIRPKAPLNEILKWEGILIDPVGALLAVIIFEAIIARGTASTSMHIVTGVFQAVFVGTVTGTLGAFFMGTVLKKHLLPDFLQNPFTLGIVVGIFVLSNSFYPESGLLAVTLMGIALANMKEVSVQHLLEFKEDLRVLIISSLFILLSARITLEQLSDLNILGSLGFLVVMFVLARPIAVILSIIATRISLKEGLFLSWVAPRGIVAAAVSSLFSLELVKAGYPNAELLVPYVFLMIVATVTIYGLTAYPVASFLGLTQASPQGVLFLGANQISRAIAKQLHSQGVKVLLVDTNYDNISLAKRDGLPNYFGNILSGGVLNRLPLDGIGKLFAMTRNDDANSLAALHGSEIFERADIYQLAPSPEKIARNSKDYPLHLRGRLLFGPELHYEVLLQKLVDGAVVKTTNITDEYTFENYMQDHKETVVPLLSISEDKQLKIFTDNSTIAPKSGEKLVSLFMSDKA